VFDVRTGKVSIIPVRAAIGPTAARSVAWLRDGEIALSGALASADRRIGLWSLTVDAAGALVRAPRLRLTPAPATGFMPSERRAGRLALETYSLKQRTFLWRDGQAREQHSTLDHADVIDVDGARGLALSRRDGDLLLYPLDGSAPPTTIAAADGTYGFRDGVITTVRPDGAPGHWAVTEIASDGTTRVAGRFTWDTAGVQLACNGAHCILFARRGDALVVRPLTPALTVGTELALPGQRGTPAPSLDGRRLLMIRDADSVVVEVDAYSGRVLAEHHVIGADCYMFGAGWRAGTPGIWAKFACADRFSLVHGPVAGRYEPILDSDGWMSGVAAFGNDAYLYSVQDNDAHLLIVLGL
jgi:hypothetical protein